MFSQVFRQVLRATPRPLLLASALFLGAAFFVSRFPDVPGASVGSYVSTALIGLPSVVALFAYLGPRGAVFSLLVLSAFAYAIETVGVATGLPYGTFSYGDALGPKALGLVPYLLPVTYVPLVIGAVAAAWRPGPPLAHVALSALLLVLVDGVLDPGAVALGFWNYPGGGVYHGVPLSNFGGWLLSGAIAAALLISLGRWRRPPPPGALDSTILTLALWAGVAALSGLVLPAALGVTLFVLFLTRRARLRLAAKQQ